MVTGGTVVNETWGQDTAEKTAPDISVKAAHTHIQPFKFLLNSLLFSPFPSLFLLHSQPLARDLLQIRIGVFRCHNIVSNEILCAILIDNVHDAVCPLGYRSLRTCLWTKIFFRARFSRNHDFCPFDPPFT